MASSHKIFYAQLCFLKRCMINIVVYQNFKITLGKNTPKVNILDTYIIISL